MEPVTIALGAIALYGLFAKSKRCPTPEEFLASNGSLNAYGQALDQCGVAGDERASLLRRASALQQQAKVMIELPSGQAVDASIIDTDDIGLFESSWCDPDEIEGPDGECYPAGVPSTNGVISRGMRGAFR